MYFYMQMISVHIGNLMQSPGAVLVRAAQLVNAEMGFVKLCWS